MASLGKLIVDFKKRNITQYFSMAIDRTKKKVVLLFLCPENAGRYRIK